MENKETAKQAQRTDSVLFRKVKKLLAKNSTTFTKLGDHVGLSLRGLRYGLQNRSLSYDKTMAIAKYFQVSVIDLMDDNIVDVKMIKHATDIVEMINIHEKAGKELADNRKRLELLTLRLTYYEELVRYFKNRYPDNKVSEFHKSNPVYFPDKEMFEELREVIKS